MKLQEAFFILVIMSNFYMLGTSRIDAVIRAAGVQGLILGPLLFLFHDHLDSATVAIGISTIFIKGIAIPSLLYRAMRDVQIRRESKPFLGYVASMLLGAIGTGAAVVFANTLPLIPGPYSWLLVPASFSTVLTGFILLVTRVKAINQVIGFLALENGIFIFGLLLLNAVPFLVEVGVLLDLLVAVFVMGIILNYIQRTFSSLDTVRLASLKDS